MQNRRLRKLTLLVQGFLSISVITVQAQEDVTGTHKQKPFVFSKADAVIYVSDFDLDSADFQTDQPAQRYGHRVRMS